MFYRMFFSNFNNIVSAILISLLFSIGSVSSVSSQELRQEEEIKTKKEVISYKEDFSGKDELLILGGQVGLQDSDSKWRVLLSDEKLIMDNEYDSKSLHYDDISWVKYPDSKTIASTKGALIAVTVKAQSYGLSAAGFLVGSGHRGQYWMFGVDGQGRFHVMQKTRGKLAHVHSGKHKAINVDKSNRVSFKYDNENIVFFVNEVEMMRVSLRKLNIKSFRKEKMPGIGLAAFGKGHFSFDDVEIKPGF